MESITIYLNIKCNIDCDYCFVDKKNSFLSRPHFEKILRWFMEQGGERKYINFFGGEPTLSASLLVGLKDLLRGTNPAGKPIVIRDIPTNGIIVDEAMIKSFKEEGIKLAFSLDGLEFEHNRHRIHKRATFDRILKNLGLYRELYHTPRIKCTVHPEMSKDLDKRVMAFIHAGFREVQIHPVFGLSWSGEQVQAYRESIDKIVRFYMKFLKTGRDDIKIHPFQRDAQRVLNNEVFDGATSCHLGSEPVFMPDGKAYGCTMVMNYRSELMEQFCIGHIDTGVDLAKMASLLSRSCPDGTKFCCRRIFDTTTRGLASQQDIDKIFEIDTIAYQAISNVLSPARVAP